MGCQLDRCAKEAKSTAATVALILVGNLVDCFAWKARSKDEGDEQSNPFYMLEVGLPCIHPSPSPEGLGPNFFLFFFSEQAGKVARKVTPVCTSGETDSSPALFFYSCIQRKHS